MFKGTVFSVLVLVAMFTGKASFDAGLENIWQSHLQPLALAAGDVDGDGMPDLIEAHGSGNTGQLTLRRGNVDALFPNAPEAQERRRLGTFTAEPFLVPPIPIDLSFQPDFVGVGDFNTDGRNDLIAASRDSDHLTWLLGNNDLIFRFKLSGSLNGRLTALIVADTNRRDGLLEVIAGVSRKDGDFLLVFESPEGAIHAEPEEIAMPGSITAIAAGQLDDDYPRDLAILMGDTLVIVHGRDRKLSQSPRRQAEVRVAEVTVLALPFAGSGVAVGDFLWTPDYRPEIAVLSDDGRRLALVSYNPGSRDYTVHNVRLTGTLPQPDGSQPARMTRARFSGLPPDDLILSSNPARMASIRFRVRR